MGAPSGVEQLKEVRENVKMLRSESEDLRNLAEGLRAQSVMLLEQSSRIRSRVLWHTLKFQAVLER